MAESHNLDVYNCDICKQNMLERNPKVLSCLHSFCAECIVQLHKTDIIECPTCQQKTNLPEGHISELQTNHTLQKFKTELDNLLNIKHVLCQLCKSVVASLKCQECSYFLCDNCRKSHNKVNTFTDHHLFELCPKHKDCMMAHVCVRCVQPVCSTCVIEEHSEHEEHIQPYTEGKKEIITNIERLQSQVRKKEDLYQYFIKTEKEKIKNISKAEHILDEMIQIAKENLEHLNEFREKENMIIKKSEKGQLEIVQMNKQLTELLTRVHKDEFNGFSCLEVQTLLSNVHLSPGNVYLQHPASQQIMSMTDFIKLESLPKIFKGRIIPMKVTFKEPEFVKTVSCPQNGGWSWPFNISVVDENSVIITDREKGTVAKAYQTDEPPRKVPVPTGYGKIQDTLLLGDYMYFIFKDCIVEKPKSGRNREIILKPGLCDIRQCVIISEGCFVLLCETQIHTFNSNTNMTRKVVDNLPSPRSLSLGYTEGEEIFAVTCDGTHSVLIYNKAWKKLHTLGGYGFSDGLFKKPFDTAFTPDSIIVADAANHRISLFDFNGKFMKHLIDELSGYPAGIAFNYPYIWISQHSKDAYPLTVSLYKIC